MKKVLLLIMVALLLIFSAGCVSERSSDRTQQLAQEQITKEGTAKTGMPAIKNFRERKIVKDTYEKRDQEGLVTYTYIVAENTGKFVFIGETIGYGVPASQQFSNPSKIEERSGSGYAILPQAEPNGLYSPTAAEGTWVMMRNPKTGEAEPQYIEPRIAVFTFKLDESLTK